MEFNSGFKGLIIVLRHVSNIQVYILRKTCTCSFVVLLSCIHISSLVDGRMCLISMSIKHVSLPSTRLLICMNGKTPLTVMYKSSWGWTLGCSKHVKDNTGWTQKHSLISNSYKIKTCWNIHTKLVATVAETHSFMWYHTHSMCPPLVTRQTSMR